MIKYIVRTVLFYAFSLWLVSDLYQGFTISGSFLYILLSGFVLSLLMLCIKPLLKILFIPINILTLGLLQWSINCLVIWLLTVCMDNIVIQAWNFSGAAYAGFSVPRIYVSYLISLIIVSVGITAVHNFLHSLTD